MNLLIVTIFMCSPKHFSQFSFPTSLRLFPFYSLGSIRRHRRLQLVLLLFYRDPLLMIALYIIPLAYGLVQGTIYYQ